MTRGYLYSPDDGGRVKVMDGEPGWLKMLGIGTRSVDLAVLRCSSCGFAELYADPEVKPEKTLKSIDEENERLRSLVTRLQDRVATLEAIATDPAERTAREIEALRALPPKSEGDT
jgi:hypothetical protein